MKKSTKNILLLDFLFLLSAIPLLLKFPYLIASWDDSIFERNDIFIWILIPFVALLSELIRRKAVIVKKNPSDRKIFYITFGILLLLYIILAFKLNVVGFILGILILFIAVKLRFGKAVFLAQIPTVVFALITTPNLSFWANYSLDLGSGSILSFFFSKLLLCFVFFVLWTIHTLHFKRYPRLSSITFCSLALLSIIFASTRSRDIKSGDAFYIDSNILSVDDWVGMELPQTESDKRLFSPVDDVSRRLYYNDNSYVSLLTISSEDKSKIHPVEICIKSTGDSVISSKQIYLSINDKNIQANEIIFSTKNTKIAEYSIFSNDKFSTGYFTKFRLSPKTEKFIHYQIATPVLESEEETRKIVVNLLEKISH